MSGSAPRGGAGRNLDASAELNLLIFDAYWRLSILESLNDVEPIRTVIFLCSFYLCFECFGLDWG